ncbi:MAG: hypothetical protein P1P93_00240 [Gammaproteobacteria bacterium]|nr:hypothetical protein [Gammaproteobacteria bacterium]
MNSKSNHTSANASKKVDFPSFTAQQCDDLFAAVLVHDEIHADAVLPDSIHLDYTQQQLKQCYALCRQLWQQGVERDSLINLVNKLLSDQTLTAEQQLVFRDIRAKMKHLRFAYQTLDHRHKYPTKFHWLTAALGYLQDAFRNKQTNAIIRFAMRSRLFLTHPFYHFVVKEIDNFKPSMPENFQHHINNEINFIRTKLTEDEITSREFHEMRKVISRLVALYDNLKILYPMQYHNQISKYLGTINGLMGSLHDELIAKKFNKTQNYYSDTFKIPADIESRLTALTEKFLKQ